MWLFGVGTQGTVQGFPYLSPAMPNDTPLVLKRGVKIITKMSVWKKGANTILKEMKTNL